ncbi:hypothetical protein ACKWRH_06890 [Bradyrhizobium sp. Pa8]|uniref:hypothetical protein n=1 Tax=Bradyrhizobium sp. Pa8 TaxID=3386552 RepID=UPI00403F9C04
MQKFALEQIDEIWRRQQQREAERRERIRVAVAESAAPLPEELAEVVIRLNDTHTRAILREHKGFALAERRDSYRTSLSILEQCIQDLLVAIDCFETAALSDDSGYFSPGGENDSGRTERRIQKELFATANAAASLVDHARRVHKLHPMLDYETTRIACFGADGLHEFVIGLRVALHHLHAVTAGWNIVRSFSEGTSTATFVICKALLLRVLDAYADRFGSGRKAMQTYIDASPEQIDLRNVFLDYRARAMRFHGWMSNELGSDALVALRDYDALIRRKINADKLMFWKAMMGNWLRNWKTPPDPHKHLARYLTPTQLEEVYRLPRNSKEQVDLVIKYVDRENAIDDDLRNQAYELFARSPTVDDVPSASCDGNAP